MGTRKLALLGGHIQPCCPHPWVMPREAGAEQEEGHVLPRALPEAAEVSGVSRPCSWPGCKSVAGVTVRDDKASPSQRAGSRCEPGVKP